MISKPTANTGKLVVYGAGGHGLVVAEAALAAAWEVLGFLDDRALEAPSAAGAPATKATAQAGQAQPGASAGRWPVLPLAALDDPEVGVIVAIGDNAARQRLCRRLLQAGRNLVSVIDPGAAVSPSAIIGRGVFVAPLAVVNAQAQLGDGVIVNSGAIVEHQCVIEECAHVAPNAAVAGAASVGALSLIGMGANVLPRVRVGRGCTVGAGAVVIADVADNVTVVGVPARPRR